MPSNMLIEEVFGTGSGELEFTSTGGSAYREFECDWDDAIPHMPLVGDPHPEYPELTVSRVRLVPYGASVSDTFGNRTERRRIQITYSFDYSKPRIGDAPRAKYSGRTEVLNTGAGRIWDDTGKIVESEEMSAAVAYPVIDVQVSQAIETLDLSKITSLQGKVNSTTFMGADAGMVLFLTFTVDPQYDYDKRTWYYLMQYNFLWRSRNQNQCWRAPEYDRDVNGNLQYYQNKDNTAPNYTANAALASTPVYKDGDSGAGAWTTTTPKTYESADLNTLFT